MKRAKGIEERTDNKLAGEPPTAIIPPTWAERPLNENLDVRIMSKPSTGVNAFLRIMRIFFDMPLPHVAKKHGLANCSF